jgi:hypothetical protein
MFVSRGKFSRPGTFIVRTRECSTPTNVVPQGARTGVADGDGKRDGSSTERARTGVAELRRLRLTTPTSNGYVGVFIRRLTREDEFAVSILSSRSVKPMPADVGR